MSLETFNDIVGGDRYNGVRGKPAQEDGECKDHIVEVILQRGTVQAKGYGENDKAWQPESVESEFRLPDSAIAPADPKRDAVICEMSVELGNDDAKPETEEDCKLLLRNVPSRSIWGKNYTRHSVMG